MLKRIIMIFLLLSIVPIITINAYWANQVIGAEGFFQASIATGSWLPEETTHIIYNQETLEEALSVISPENNYGEDLYITLTTDIEVDLGESLGHFGGVFDGNGHTISGIVNSTNLDTLPGNGKEGFGLFGDVTINGVLKNLTLEICLTFDEEDNADGSAYYFGGIAAFNYGIIDNVHIKPHPDCPHGGLHVNFGSTRNGTLIHMGGLVGENKGTVINSSSEINMNLNFRNKGSTTIGQTQEVFIGGLVGKNVNKSNQHVPVGYRARVEESSSSGKIHVHVEGRQFLLSKTTTNVFMGGIMGYNDAGTYNNIYYYGNVNTDLTYSKDSNDRGTARIRELIGN